MLMDFGNVLTAMVTPFDQNGDINYEQVTELIEYLLKNGTDGLIITGTTGESPTLSNEEKIALCQHTVHVVKNRVPVIAGTGSNDTKASISLTKEAEASGVDGIMLVTPYYNKPSQKGLYEHFAAIAKETKLPVMLYNIPGRSVVNMTAQTIINLSKLKNIVSVKEASGDLDQVSEIIRHTDDNFSVYSGDDGMTLPMLSIGGAGVVSVASHIIGKEMQGMIQDFWAGKVKQAARTHQRLLPIMKSLFTFPSPAPVKAALQWKGIDTGTLRLPLMELTLEEKQELQKWINE